MTHLNPKIYYDFDTLKCSFRQFESRENSLVFVIFQPYAARDKTFSNTKSGSFFNAMSENF